MPQEIQQRIHLFIGSDGNAQIIVNPRFIEIPHINLFDLHISFEILKTKGENQENDCGFTEVLKIYGPPFQNIWPAVSKYMARGFIMYGPTCRNSKETHSYLPLVTNTIGDALRDITTGVTTWGLRVVIGVENGK